MTTTEHIKLQSQIFILFCVTALLWLAHARINELERTVRSNEKALAETQLRLVIKEWAPGFTFPRTNRFELITNLLAEEISRPDIATITNVLIVRTTNAVAHTVVSMAELLTNNWAGFGNVTSSLARATTNRAMQQVLESGSLTNFEPLRKIWELSGTNVDFKTWLRSLNPNRTATNISL